MSPQEIYEMIHSKHTLDDTPYISHGIKCHGPSGTKIEDISTNERMVSQMVKLFNVCELPADPLERVVVELLP